MPSARPTPRDPRPHRRVLASVRAGLVWGVAAAAVSLVMWLGMKITGVPVLIYPGQSQAADATSLGPLSIIGATLFAALVAGIAAGILGKLVRSAARWIVFAGAVLTLASLTAPWSQPSMVPVSTRVALTVMHLAAGFLVTYGLARGMSVDDRAVAV